MRKKIWGNRLAFALRKRKQDKISRFSFVIVSVWMVNGGLARKASIGPKRALLGQFLLFPRGCEVWRIGPIGPEKARIGPGKPPISPAKARFSRADLPPNFCENLGFKPPFVIHRLDFSCLRFFLFFLFVFLFFQGFSRLREEKNSCLSLLSSKRRVGGSG